MPDSSGAAERIRVLLVDDDEDDFRVIREMVDSIDGKPFYLEWVGTYPEALEAIRRREHSVYVLDYRLDEMTGLDLLLEARGLGCDEPMIILTGWANRCVDRSSLQAGAADFLDKAGLTADRLERSLRYSIERAGIQRNLELQIHSKDQFVASVSHELRTPLTAVLGFAELLREQLSESASAETLEMVGLVARQAQYAANIVSDLLVTAAPEKVIVRVEPVDLRREAAEAVADLGLDERVTLAVAGPALVVQADNERLKQIIRNLLTNAVRYGGEHIGIDLAEGDGLVAVEVWDDGAGIVGIDELVVFDPYQSKGTAGAQPGAMGLGLTVSRTLARIMGGDLTYERSVGRTVFRLTLAGADTGESEKTG